MTSASQSLNIKFGTLKTAATALNASTPIDEVRKITQDLRDLQTRIQQTVQNNPQAIMALALSQKALPKLIKNCEALLPPDARTDAAQQPAVAPATVQQPATRHEGDTVSHTPVVVHTVAMEGLSHPTLARPAIRGQRKAPTVPKMQPQNAPAMTEAPTVEAPVTEIRVRCRVPFGHTLAIRGQGGGLDWSSGRALTQIDAEVWSLRLDGTAGRVEYKLLLDDRVWEGGGNRSIEAEKTQEIVPALSFPNVAVIAHCDVPGDTRLFIRGTAEGMSWAKGTELKRVNGKFVLESDRDLGRFEFKILRDDQHWSQGDNFVSLPGQTLEVSPRF